MSKEYVKPIRVSLGTVRKPKYEVEDVNGSTSFTLDSSSQYRIIDEDGDVIEAWATATINNSDTDRNSNTIKTIEGTFDSSATALASAGVGRYLMVFRVALTNGETIDLSVPIIVFEPSL